MTDLEGVTMADLEQRIAEARAAASQMEWERHNRLHRVLVGELRAVALQVVELSQRLLAAVETLEQDWIEAPETVPNGRVRGARVPETLAQGW